jgi:hypothetical protein
MSSMAMGFMGILPGSAQSLISGNAQYHDHSISTSVVQHRYTSPAPLLP